MATLVDDKIRLANLSQLIPELAPISTREIEREEIMKRTTPTLDLRRFSRIEQIWNDFNVLGGCALN